MKYELVLPKDSPLDPAAIERTVAIARERGLSPEQAQVALDLAASEVAALQAAHDAQYEQVVAGWKEKTLNDPALGDTLEKRLAKVQKANGVVEWFAKKDPTAGGEFKAIMEEEGYGNHPVVVRFLAAIAEASGEKQIVHGSPTQPTVDVAKKIYPNMN